MRPGATRVVTVDVADDVGAALGASGVPVARPVLILLGGADGLDPALERALWPTFAGCLSPLAQEFGAAIVDGGSDAGVMRMIGRARRSAGHDYPLVGVSAAGTIGDRDTSGRTAPSDASHSHLVIVPGERWGDESPWLRMVARSIAGQQGLVALVVNGGAVAHDEAVDCANSGIPVVLLAGSGRAADGLVATLGVASSDAAALMTSIDLLDSVGLREVLAVHLVPRP